MPTGEGFCASCGERCRAPPAATARASEASRRELAEARGTGAISRSAYWHRGGTSDDYRDLALGPRTERSRSAGAPRRAIGGGCMRRGEALLVRTATDGSGFASGRGCFSPIFNRCSGPVEWGLRAGTAREEKVSKGKETVGFVPFGAAAQKRNPQPLATAQTSREPVHRPVRFVPFGLRRIVQMCPRPRRSQSIFQIFSGRIMSPCEQLTASHNDVLRM
jgi:hypothetical protein